MTRSVVLIAMLAATCCDRLAPAPPSTQPTRLTWDVSLNNRIERVGWPADVTDDVWGIDGPGVVRLKIRGGIEHDVAFNAAQVWRKGPRIKTIRLMCAIGTIDQVYTDAMKLAADWHINDTKEIAVFRDTKALQITSGGSGVYRTRGGDELVQGRSIEIRQSFNSASGKPYLPILAMGFIPDYDLPATQPASRPVEREQRP